MSLTPPLIAMMEGRKPRARREHIPTPKELVLQFAVAKLLREHCLPEWEWAHYPSGEHRGVCVGKDGRGKKVYMTDIRTATKLKQMGAKAHWPDFIFVAPDNTFRCLELKREGEDLDDGQEEFRERCIKRGTPHVVAWTMEQVLFAFETWGCLRVQFTPRRINE